MLYIIHIIKVNIIYYKIIYYKRKTVVMLGQTHRDTEAPEIDKN